MTRSVLGAALGFVILVAPAVAQQQTATTTDGKAVILKSDGTWEFAEGALRRPGIPEVRLPLTKTSDDYSLTLQDVRRQKSFFDIPLKDGQIFLVIAFRTVQGRTPAGEYLLDANGNVIGPCGSAATTQGPLDAFCIPQGRQVKAFRIGSLELDLTAVRIRDSQ